MNISPARQARVATRLGVTFLVVVPLMAFAAGLGLPVNITLLSMLTGIVVATTSRSLHHLHLPPRLNASDLALLAFVATASVGFALSLHSVAYLPPAYFVHAVVLLFVCPLAYLFGAMYGAQASPQSVRRIFHAVLALSGTFVTLTLLDPQAVTSDEAVRGSYYQYSGDCLALAALVHTSTRERKASRWPLLIVLPILVLLGSRASVAAYGAALMFSPLLPFVLGAGLVIGLLGSFFADSIATLGSELFETSRVITSLLGTFIQGNEDGSLGERQQFQQQALTTIDDHPLLGQFGYDYIANGYVGGYAHSALDLWAQYGVLALLSFLGAVVLSPLISLLAPGAPRISRRPGWHSMPLLVFLVLEFALFRHPESVVLFFGIGVLSSLAGPRLSRAQARVANMAHAARPGLPHLVQPRP